MSKTRILHPKYSYSGGPPVISEILSVQAKSLPENEHQFFCQSFFQIAENAIEFDAVYIDVKRKFVQRNMDQL